MRQKKSNGSRTGVALVALLLAATGFGVLVGYVKKSPHSTYVAPSSVTQRDDEDNASQDTKPQGKPSAVWAAVPDGNTDKLKHESVKVSDSSDKLGTVFNTILTGFDKAAVKALGVDVKDGVAVVHLNKRLEGFGSDEESKFVLAIQESFAQFPGVERVELWCDGQKLDTVGHFEISEGIAIKRGSASASDGSARPPKQP